MGEFVPQPWVVLGRRLHREQPALPCNRGCRPDPGEGGVRCSYEGRSCNSGTVGRSAPQEESAHHSAGNALRLSEMLLHGREYRKSLLPTMGACCQHTLRGSTDVQWEMRVPERFAGEAQSFAADGCTPEYDGDAFDALRRPEMLGVRSIFVDSVESLTLAMERSCVSAMKKDPTVVPPLSNGKARLRLCEDMKRKYTHTLVMQRKLATGADLLRTTTRRWPGHCTRSGCGSACGDTLALCAHNHAPRSRASALAPKTLPAWITLRRRPHSLHS